MKLKSGLMCGFAVTVLACVVWQNRRMFVVNDVTTGESRDYPHLTSRVYYCSVDRAMAVAERSVNSLDRWRVVHTDIENDAIEAEVETRVGGFIDDVTIYCKPLGPHETRVIIRSRSRVGRGDLGQNAEHIQELQGRMDNLLMTGFAL